jgi:hypothetical protein
VISIAFCILWGMEDGGVGGDATRSMTDEFSWSPLSMQCSWQQQFFRFMQFTSETVVSD